mmetsp:Transcript_54494/g.79944  ORF Transcript_54494/g.79944 Transcript_54494/m.79944 type:complete len:224 (-) Transcript_54494:88-759(-)
MNTWLRHALSTPPHLGTGRWQSGVDSSGVDSSGVASRGSSGLGRCLLIQRQEGAERHIENHHELLNALNLMGSSPCYGRWQVVSPVTGRGGMQEVARLFGEAIVIVAPHGGTLGNLIFSSGSSGGVDKASVDAASVDTASVNNDSQSTIKATHVLENATHLLGKATHVLELLPANRPNLCYERLCRALGIVYMGLVVPDSSYNEAMRVDVLHVLLSLHTLLQT